MSNLYRVGDEFEGPATLMNKFIGQVKRLGGEVKIEGKRAIITHLPAKGVVEKSTIKETIITNDPVVEKPVVEEPVVEEPVAEEPVAEEPVAEESVAEVQEEYVPKRRGRTRKVESEESEEE